MSGPEDEVSQAEKRRIIREQATTMFQHAQSHANDEAGGRFAAINPTTVTGATSAVKYPQLPSSSPWGGSQPEPGTEPPTGYAIDDMSGLENPADVSVSPSAEPGGAAAAPSAPPDVEHAAPPLSKDQDNG
jgi:hypothetical protein